MPWDTRARERTCRRVWPVSTPKPAAELWQRLYNDYLSDTIYLRYATGSPAIDPETGNVYMQGTQGILAAFTEDGRVAVAAFADGRVRAADLSQWPHRFAAH